MQYPVTFVENAEVAMETVLDEGCMVMAAASTRLGWIKLSLLPLSKRALIFILRLFLQLPMILLGILEFLWRQCWGPEGSCKLLFEFGCFSSADFREMSLFWHLLQKSIASRALKTRMLGVTTEELYVWLSACAAAREVESN